MRLWSVHPQFLDAKGLVALWRETLLAKKVLEGKTKGYKQHPQLHRFRSQSKPVDSINVYLQEIFKEAARRHYSFDRSKVNWKARSAKIPVTNGQLKYEIGHLESKLKGRAPDQIRINAGTGSYTVHPIFSLVEGQVEYWEKMAP